jgi:hypothetical protein
VHRVFGRAALAGRVVCIGCGGRWSDELALGSVNHFAPNLCNEKTEADQYRTERDAHDNLALIGPQPMKEKAQLLLF